MTKEIIGYGGSPYQVYKPYKTTMEMNCPKCNGITKTVLTRPIGDRYGNLINKHEVVRRKKCTQCNYRFYTHGLKNSNRYTKNPEKLLDNTEVIYVGSILDKNQKIRIIKENNKLVRK